MERKEMKKLYDEIDVPKVELTSAVRQAIGDVKAEQKRRWFTWNWRTPIYSAIVLIVLYFHPASFFLLLIQRWHVSRLLDSYI